MTNPGFRDRLRQQVAALGGYHNAHLHLDRAYTLDAAYVDHGRLDILRSSYISLQQKHKLIATVHEGPAYDEADLRARLARVTDDLVAAGTRLADTMVDVCDDRTQLDTLRLVNEHAGQVRDRIRIRTAAYTPFGFRRDRPSMWEVFERGVAEADFIGSLPEADDTDDYPDHIGFEEHCVRMLDLARRTQQMVHVHTDQRNEPGECGTERLIDIIRREGPLRTAEGQPLVWAVHMVSPSTYDDNRFRRLVDGMRETGLGLICCPSAALGMRQLRPVITPTGNSMPRLLELAEARIPIRLGSDNIEDMCSPSTSADLADEVFVLSCALRFYDIDILARFATGTTLTDTECERLTEHLARNEEEIARFLQRAQSTAIDPRA